MTREEFNSRVSSPVSADSTAGRRPRKCNSRYAAQLGRPRRAIAQTKDRYIKRGAGINPALLTLR